MATPQPIHHTTNPAKTFNRRPEIAGVQSLPSFTIVNRRIAVAGVDRGARTRSNAARTPSVLTVSIPLRSTATNSMRVTFCQSLFLALQRLLAVDARIGAAINGRVTTRNAVRVRGKSSASAAQGNRAAVPKHKLLLAVSGGADSVAMLRGCHQIAADLALELRVIHVDHQLRSESADDARWIADLCQTLAIPCEIRRIDVRELARRQQVGIEEAARNARYTVFQQVAGELEIGIVATAHTADDQAETVLHHVLRGTGLSGLSGIPESRPLDRQRLVRPMLRTSRADVIAYLNEIHQTCREDSTNTDETITRNRLRRSLIPLLQAQHNPQVQTALVRLAAAAAEAQQLIDTLAGELFRSSLVEQSPTKCRLRIDAIAAAPAVVIKAMIVQIWKSQAWSRQSLSADHLDAVVELIHQYQQHGSAAANTGLAAADDAAQTADNVVHTADDTPPEPASNSAARPASKPAAKRPSNRRPRFRTSLPDGLLGRITRRELVFEIAGG